MIDFILGLLLATVTLVLLVIQRVYSLIPTRELKRQARRGDNEAQSLYRAAAFGPNLRVFLTGLALVFGMLSMVCLSGSVGIWLAMIVFVLGIGVGGLVLMPLGDVSETSLWLAKKTAPTTGWLLERLQPATDFLLHFVRRHGPVTIHTGLYEKEDIVELLERQKGQSNSRISTSEITLLQHALTFGDKTVSDAMIPKRIVTEVSVGDTIGPVLMGELHDSGYSRFPVYEGKKDNIVGMLYLHDLVMAKRSGTVQSIMREKVTYVHEDFTLHQTLQAFIKTKQHLFVVVNSFEEYVGIITIEDVLEKVIGKLIVDEFDQYDDLRAVATAAARKDHEGTLEQHAPATDE